MKIKVTGRISVRVTPEDQQLLKVLNKRLGITTTHIIRLALRALATKEGI